MDGGLRNPKRPPLVLFVSTVFTAVGGATSRSSSASATADTNSLFPFLEVEVGSSSKKSSDESPRKPNSPFDLVAAVEESADLTAAALGGGATSSTLFLANASSCGGKMVGLSSTSGTDKDGFGGAAVVFLVGVALPWNPGEGDKKPNSPESSGD